MFDLLKDIDTRTPTFIFYLSVIYHKAAAPTAAFFFVQDNYGSTSNVGVGHKVK